jgi:hypothetical protein
VRGVGYVGCVLCYYVLCCHVGLSCVVLFLCHKVCTVLCRDVMCCAKNYLNTSRIEFELILMLTRHLVVECT